MSDSLVTDLSLARRLERTEGATNAAFVRARARRAPGSGATWQDFGGTYAMFDGPESPITQTFGLGLFTPPTTEGLQEIEAFFLARGAPVFHETCPIADQALLQLLPERGYRPVEQSSVLYRALRADAIPRAALDARPLQDGEAQRWIDATVQGWSDTPGIEEFMRDFGSIVVASEGVHPFLVEDGGTAIAAGALSMHDGVALLAGASTLPAHRGRGAQAALLAARLRFALDHGCDVAMMAALPGSGSQRNAERQGFRIGYTRTKWGRLVTG